jgi:hypothetical protein
MPSSEILRNVALVRTDVSEECRAFIRVTRMGELGTLAVTSSRRTTFLRNVGVTSQKTAFFLSTRDFTSPYLTSHGVFGQTVIYSETLFCRSLIHRSISMGPEQILFHTGPRIYSVFLVVSGPRTKTMTPGCAV